MKSRDSVTKGKLRFWKVMILKVQKLPRHTVPRVLNPCCAHLVSWLKEDAYTFPSLTRKTYLAKTERHAVETKEKPTITWGWQIFRTLSHKSQVWHNSKAADWLASVNGCVPVWQDRTAKHYNFTITKNFQTQISVFLPANNKFLDIWEQIM